MTHSLNPYLLAAKTDIKGKTIDLLVMGNEAADLDSMASAIAYAYITDKTEQGKTIIPLMPIARADFKLRTEAVYVFDQAGIDLDNLIFLDDLTPSAAMDRIRNLALVDHNKLTGPMEDQGRKVEIILDHHKEEALYPHAVTRVIEPVGSTATLVGEILIRDCPELIDRCLAMLLTGTILLDTVNLDPDAGRVTTKDSKVAQALMETCSMTQDQYFKAVQKAKFDTADLSTSDLLRKDYKEFKFADIRCGIASVLLPMEQWGKRDKELCLGFETYVQRRDLDVLISMNAYTDPDFNRDLAVYCMDSETHDNLIAFLNQKGLGLKDISLDTQKPCLQGRISFHAQENLGISRKKLSPLLDEYFTG